MSDKVRKFETGATRTADTGKPDYEGYLSPLVIREFGKYMTKHRHLPDGSLRASDNWQKGIPLDAYMKSLWRHLHELWMIHRGHEAIDHEGKRVDLYDTLSAILFNAQGYFHETIKRQEDLKAVANAKNGECVKVWNPEAVHFSFPENVGTDPQAQALNEYLEKREPKATPYAPYYAAQAPRRQTQAMHLRQYGCLSNVADYIASGTIFGDVGFLERFIYIAGPMRGYPGFNFPAFDAARDRFLQKGYSVISPADIDRATGLNEKDHATGDCSKFDQKDFVYRDFFALYFIAKQGNGAIAMLPGWEKSTGAAAEFFLARWLGLKVLNAETGDPLRDYDRYAILLSIDAVVRGQK